MCIENRLRKVLETTMDVRQLTEKAYDSNLFLCFVDLEKTFDSAAREEMWELPEQRKV